MPEFIVLKSFNGSPNGAVVVHFEKDEIIDGAQLGEDLTEVALKEEWIGEHEASQDDDDEPVTIHELMAAIEHMDKDNPELWTNKGAPKTEALEQETGKEVTGPLRDEAFAKYQESLPPQQ